MSASKEFLQLLVDQLSALGEIRVRRMFGGAGLYCDDTVFAFVDDDTLYLKTDQEGRAVFEAEGMGPFTYTTKHGPGTLISYWRAPERLLDDGDELAAWAARAIAVSRQSGAKKNVRRRKALPGARKRPPGRVKSPSKS